MQNSRHLFLAKSYILEDTQDTKLYIGHKSMKLHFYMCNRASEVKAQNL